MSRARGEANRGLYRAKILLEAWDGMRTGSSHSEAALIDGFLPAVRAHLLEAYGWFLLAVSDVDDERASLPQSTGDLPDPEPGRALMPEIAEFAQLEANGWIAQLIQDPANGSHPLTGNYSAPGSSQGLLVSDRQPLGFAVATTWADSLTAIMNRMDDSLSEC